MYAGTRNLGETAFETCNMDHGDIEREASIEVQELERAADWRIRKLGENPADAQSAAAAALLQKLANDVRRLQDSPVHTEYLALLNWLGEFDVSEDFAERANDYRGRIGVEHFPGDGDAYLRALIALARETAGT
jgi:hypothetical protein